MPNWESIGLDNFKVACRLVASGESEVYGSCVSRFYYAAFSALTQSLSGNFDTSNGQETPTRRGLPKLIREKMPNRSDGNRTEVLKMIRRLYDARLDADYRQRTVDRLTAQKAIRDTAAIFRALGLKYDD